MILKERTDDRLGRPMLKCYVNLSAVAFVQIDGGVVWFRDAMRRPKHRHRIVPLQALRFGAWVKMNLLELIPACAPYASQKLFPMDCAVVIAMDFVLTALIPTHERPLRVVASLSKP